MLNSLKIAILAALAEAVGPGTRVVKTSAAPRFRARDPLVEVPYMRPLRGPLTVHDHERIAKAEAKRQRKAEARLRVLRGA